MFNITNPKSNEEKDTATTKNLYLANLQLNLKPSPINQSLLLVHQLLQINQLLVLVRPQILLKKATPNSKPSLFGDAFKASDKTESSTTSKPSFSFGFNNATTTPFSLGGGEKKDTTPSSTPFTLGKTDTTKDDTKPTETTSLFGDNSKSGSTTPFTFGQKDDKAAGDSKKKTNWLQQLNHLVQGLPLEHLLKLLKAMMDLKENQIMMLLQVQLQQQQQLRPPSSLVLLIKQAQMQKIKNRRTSH